MRNVVFVVFVVVVVFFRVDRRLSVKLHSEGGETINLHSFEKQTNDLNKLKMRCNS